MQHPFAGVLASQTHEPVATAPVLDAVPARRTFLSFLASLFAFFGLTSLAQAFVLRPGGRPTQSFNEGGGPTTLALNQAEGGRPLTSTQWNNGEFGGTPTSNFNESGSTTYALGEEGGTTNALGEGGGSTRALGEEGGSSTSLALGEEGGTTNALGEGGGSTRALGEGGGSTRALGEEGGVTTLALGEEGR